MELRNATHDDWKILLEWRNNIETRKNSFNINVVEKEEHKNWLKETISSSVSQLYIALEDDIPVASVRADMENEVYNLSWTVAPSVRGKGIGKKVVRFLAEKLGTKIRAEIKEGNIASIKIAEYAGMKFNYKENEVLHYSNF